MSWQEEEIKKRKTQQVIAEAQGKEIQRKGAILKQNMNEIWQKLLTANERLPSELRMSIKHSYEEVMKGTGTDCSLTYQPGSDRIEFRGYNHGHCYIMYDIENAVAFFIPEWISSFAGYVPRYSPGSGCYLLTDAAILIIIRNLCTGRNITDDLIPKRKKFLGIF